MHEQPSVIEVGAGKGTFAYEYLKELEKKGTDINRYYILEISADLRDRQMELISGLPKSIRDKVTWLESLDMDPVDGILIANEVIDALPFKRFIIKNEQVFELGITLSEGELEEATR